VLADRGSAVAGVSKADCPCATPAAEWLAVDLRHEADHLIDFLARFEPDVVVHLAASGQEAVAAAGAADVITDNLLSTLHTLGACRRLARSPRCLIVSSSAVYGCSESGPSGLRETDALQPLTIYGVTKTAVETLALQQWRSFHLPVVVVRPFNLTGPGEHRWFVTSAFARQVALIEAGRQAAMIRVGNLDTARDFTDVRDAAEALAQLAERGEAGETYNICSGVPVKIESLLKSVLRTSRTPIRIEPDPALMRPVEVQAQWGDSSRLRRATEWHPRFAFDRTIADVVDDWRSRIAGGQE
jgi:GDP-4-dehydro-6-deoxy-D-mannose reductase